MRFEERTCLELEAPSPDLVAALRELMQLAYGAGFSSEDWDHACGGRHFVVMSNETPLAHASVVPRTLAVPQRELAVGYVEAVATRPELQRTGLGTAVMRAAQQHIGSAYELGGLSTGSGPFYQRLGWEQWLGPTHVRTPAGWVRTPEEDGGVWVLRTPATPELNLAQPISCDWRPGDAW